MEKYGLYDSPSFIEDSDSSSNEDNSDIRREILKVLPHHEKKNTFRPRNMFGSATDVATVSFKLQEYIQNNTDASIAEHSKVPDTSFKLNSIVRRRNSIISGHLIDLPDVVLNNQSKKDEENHNVRIEIGQSVLEDDVNLLDIKDSSQSNLDWTTNVLSDVDRSMMKRTSKILLPPRRLLSTNCILNDVPLLDINTHVNGELHHRGDTENSDIILTNKVTLNKSKKIATNSSQDVPLGEVHPNVIKPKSDTQLHHSSNKENSDTILTNKVTLKKGKKTTSNSSQDVPLGEVNPNIIKPKPNKQLHHSSGKENSDVIITTEPTRKKSTRTTTKRFQSVLFDKITITNDDDAEQLHHSNVKENSDTKLTKNMTQKRNKKVSVLNKTKKVTKIDIIHDLNKKQINQSKLNTNETDTNSNDQEPDSSSTQNLDYIRSRENGRLRKHIKKPQKFEPETFYH